eukprot:30525-Eustigmatos_ZCMA.PRE.1
MSSSSSGSMGSSMRDSGMSTTTSPPASFTSLKVTDSIYKREHTQAEVTGNRHEEGKIEDNRPRFTDCSP